MEANQPRSRRISLSTGLSYHVLEWDPADPGCEHTVVLLHGFLDFAWGFEGLVNAGLFGRYHLVAPDLRGHGDSDRVGPGGYYHFMDYVADVQDLIAQVGRTRVSLVCHSMGGSVGAYYTGAFPERVHRLALLEGLGPPEHDVDETASRVATWVAAWRRVAGQKPRPVADLQTAAARMRSHDPQCDEALALRLAEMGTVALPDGRRVFKHDPLHVTPGPYPYTLAMAASFWRRISCPVLVVEAEHSQFRFPKEERDKRLGHFKDVREALLADAGHMMQRHRPTELAALLTDFLG